MAETGNVGSRFSELFELIADYARRDRGHQEKALRLISVAYEGVPAIEGMPDARQAVDDILSRHVRSETGCRAPPATRGPSGSCPPPLSQRQTQLATMASVPFRVRLGRGGGQQAKLVV